MNIVFDGQIFLLQSYGGISRYFTSLASELSGLENKVRIIAPVHRNAYLRDLPAGVVRGVNVAKLPARGGRFLSVFNHQVTQGCLSIRAPDIVHETYYSAATVAPRSCPVVVTVYDMIHELFSEEFSANDPGIRFKRMAIDRADHVICISESTRQDLIRLYGTAEEKLSVVHLGFGCMGEGKNIESDKPVRPFILYVGSRSGYKNFSGLLRAVAASPQLKADFDVVAFGGGAFVENELDIIAKLGLDIEHVKQVSGSDAVLGALYKNASVFIYPSLYEGFGLPPLEAMARDCPVVSSNTSSMPEVIGNAAEFFDPSDCDDMRSAIERVVFHQSRQDELRQYGHSRLQEFSWGKCARETLSIYKKVGA